jgi:uncharacterized membrane protein
LIRVKYGLNTISGGNMNYAHIHLIINHIPILTIPMAMLFLIYGIRQKNESLKRFSMLVLIATAASLIPVYLTGEPAEKVIEHLPGISKNLIEAHEEAAELALILTLVVGGMALAVMLFPRWAIVSDLGPKAIVLASIVAVGALGYTANLGGKIHHPETSDSTFTVPTVDIEHGGKESGDKDDD